MGRADETWQASTWATAHAKSTRYIIAFPLHTTPRGTRLVIAAASTAVGRAKSSISRLLCLTRIGLLGRLGVGRSELTRLPSWLLPFVLRMRLPFRLAENGRLPLSLLNSGLEQTTVVLIEQRAEATDLMGLEAKSIVYDLLAGASKIGKSRARE